MLILTLVFILGWNDDMMMQCSWMHEYICACNHLWQTFNRKYQKNKLELDIWSSIPWRRRIYFPGIAEDLVGLLLGTYLDDEKYHVCVLFTSNPATYTVPVALGSYFAAALVVLGNGIMLILIIMLMLMVSRIAAIVVGRPLPCRRRLLRIAFQVTYPIHIVNVHPPTYSYISHRRDILWQKRYQHILLRNK